MSNNDNSGFTPKEYVPVSGVILADTPIEYNTNRRTTHAPLRHQLPGRAV